MRKTIITKTCDHCGATLKPDSFNSKDQLVVAGLQIQNAVDSRANLAFVARTEDQLMDFCNPYCIREYITDHFKAVQDALEKSDLEEQHALDDLTDVLADKEPGELI